MFYMWNAFLFMFSQFIFHIIINNMFIQYLHPFLTFINNILPIYLPLIKVLLLPHFFKILIMHLFSYFNNLLIFLLLLLCTYLFVLFLLLNIVTLIYLFHLILYILQIIQVLHYLLQILQFILFLYMI